MLRSFVADVDRALAEIEVDQGQKSFVYVLYHFRLYLRHKRKVSRTQIQPRVLVLYPEHRHGDDGYMPLFPE